MTAAHLARMENGPTMPSWTSRTSRASRRRAAEQREHLARDVARIEVRCEEHVRGRHLLWLRRTPVRGRLTEPRRLFGVAVRRVERRPYGPRRHGVDADA